MNVMGFLIETAVLPFQHGSHRSRQIAPHPLGEPGLDQLQISRHKNPQRPLGKQFKMFFLRNHIDDILAADSIVQFLFEHYFGDILILCKAQIVLAGIYFTRYPCRDPFGKSTLAGAAFAKNSDNHNCPFYIIGYSELFPNSVFAMV